MILDITAVFRCDGCGKRFSVKIEPATYCSQDLAASDLAEDALREGDTYRDDDADPQHVGSVVNWKHYCAACTKGMGGG